MVRACSLLKVSPKYRKFRKILVFIAGFLSSLEIFLHLASLLDLKPSFVTFINRCAFSATNFVYEIFHHVLLYSLPQAAFGFAFGNHSPIGQHSSHVHKQWQSHVCYPFSHFHQWLFIFKESFLSLYLSYLSFQSIFNDRHHKNYMCTWHFLTLIGDQVIQWMHMTVYFSPPQWMHMRVYFSPPQISFICAIFTHDQMYLHTCNSKFK